jgi:hypothetical protein
MCHDNSAVEQHAVDAGTCAHFSEKIRQVCLMLKPGPSAASTSGSASTAANLTQWRQGMNGGMMEGMRAGEAPDVLAGVAAAAVHGAMEEGGCGGGQQGQQRQTKAHSLHACGHVKGGRA